MYNALGFNSGWWIRFVPNQLPPTLTEDTTARMAAQTPPPPPSAAVELEIYEAALLNRACFSLSWHHKTI